MNYPLSKKHSTLINIATAILIVGAVILCIYLVINPPSRIKVSTFHLPIDTKFVSVVSKSGGTVKNMNFYLRSELIMPFTAEPSDCGWTKPEHDDLWRTVGWRAYVQWEWGEQYGVVTTRGDNIWRVTWFRNRSRVEQHEIKGFLQSRGPF
jgi:hypothetical protein